MKYSEPMRQNVALFPIYYIIQLILTRRLAEMMYEQ